MFCRLTLIGAMISLAAASAAGLTAASPPVSHGGKSTPATLHSIEWRQLPLGDAIERLRAIFGAEVFLDRRVDPTQRVNLTLGNAGLDEIIAQMSAACSLGHAQLGPLAYIGPPQSAERLVAVVAARHREAAKLPTDLRRTLLERRRIVWPQLTVPRGLVTKLSEEHRWTMLGSERIPHDLWAAGAMPALPLADQLAVLLAGFDLTYRLTPEKRSIEIVPLDWNAIKPAPATSQASQQNPKPTTTGKRVFTLRIENQPVGKVLEQLGRRLGWKLTVDEAAIRAAGRSLDEEVSFTVENADEDQLLRALLAPAKLQAQRDGKNVRVMPR